MTTAYAVQAQNTHAGQTQSTLQLNMLTKVLNNSLEAADA